MLGNNRQVLLKHFPLATIALNLWQELSRRNNTAVNADHTAQAFVTNNLPCLEIDERLVVEYDATSFYSMKNFFVRGKHKLQR